VSGAGDSSQYIDGTGALQTFPTIPTELRDLSDVDISGPVQNDTLLFNAAMNEFQNGQLGAVAYSNDYNDLDNLPTIPAAQVNSDWNASSGVAQILNKPTIPAAQIQSDWTQANTAALDYIKNKPTLPGTIGDMLKSVYDIQNIGVVESAHKELVAVINKTGASVPAGSIVYLKTSSASGTFPEIVLATATTESGSSKTMGAVWQTIANDATGYVVTSGEVSNLDTSAYSIGDRLWLGTTAGSVTTTPPAEPNHTVFIGTVTRAQNGNGRILYAIQNGYELNELHGVQITTEANRQVLIYDSASGLWVNRLLAAADMPTGIDAANIGSGNVSNTEFGYLDGVTSAIQTQLNGKQATIGLTTVGTNLATLTNPSAIRFLRINADNTVTARTAAEMVTDLGITSGSTSLLYQSQNATNVPASSIYFGCLFGGALSIVSADTLRRTPIATAGTISRLYVQTSSAQPATGSLVCTVRKNSVDQTLTLTIAAGSAAGVFTDLVNSVSVVAGDFLGMKFQNNATTTSANVLSNQVILTI
jgi:hypothetical protein